LAVSTPVFSKDTVVESIWAALPLTIDGAPQDWDDATPLTDKMSNAQYALKNDGRNLYVIMVFRDAIARSTIGFTGMKIYVSADGKKSKDSGILFHQKPMTPDELIASLEAKGEVLSEDRKSELRRQTSYLAYLEEAIVPKKGAAPAGTEAKPEPAMFRSAQKGELAIYEFKIPLSRIGQPGSVQPGAAIKVGFEWGGVTKEIMKNIMADRAASGASARQSAGSSDSGFSDSGGEGGGGGPDFSYSRDPRYKKHAFWIDAKLAAQ
jgi:uncharacterized membrane protein YgcG